MNVNEELIQFRENGFLHVPNFFEKNEIEQIRREAKEVFLIQMYNLGFIDSMDISEEEFEKNLMRFFQQHLDRFINCGKQAQHLISLHRLGVDQRLVKTLNRLGLSFPNICTRPVMFFNSRHLAKKEVYWKVFAHQDWRSMQGSLDSIVVWIPLIDIDKSLGALEVVPGSHKLGLLDSEITDSFGKISDQSLTDLEFVPLEVSQGDAVFFSAFLIHQSGNNVTDSIRWSCHFRFNNLNETTFIQRGLPNPYIYKPQEDLITANFPSKEQIRRIYG